MTSERGVLSYPIPLYQNVPIESQFYEPSRFLITAISLGQTTTVTTSVNHNYVINQQVRLIIPPSFGSYQLNESQGYVLSIPNTNQVVLSINSSLNVDAFVSSSSTVVSAQILAIGDVSSGATNPNPVNSNLNIPGSFINISPL